MDDKADMTFFLLNYLVELLRSVIFTGFLYLFFDKPKRKSLRVVPTVVTAFLLFVSTYYYSLSAVSEAALWQAVTALSMLLIYSIGFLRGSIILRIVMPISLYGISVLLEWLVAYAVVGYYSAVFGSGNLNTMLYGVIFSAGKWLSFASLAVVTLLCFLLLRKRNRDNRLKTELLLSEQREEMYRRSVLETNERIEKMSLLKHDMQNHLGTVRRLIEAGRLNEATALCGEADALLATVITPADTANPTLNAILNVESEKAATNDIVFHYTVGDPLLFITPADLVTIIGNLCDNAIEYLQTLDNPLRRMSLNITARGEYRLISCQNPISASVLANNPELYTSKGNTEHHGKGIKLLRSVAKKYGGELRIEEAEQEICFILFILDDNRS